VLARPDAGAPNVLLIVLDTVRRRDVSLYGYARPTTPALSRWAAGGAVFEDAIATAPWTLPSHGSLLTGQLPEELGGGAFDRSLRSPTPSLAELLRAQGYQTAGFVANMLYTSYETGLSRGFMVWDGHPRRYALQTIVLNCPLAQTGLFIRLSRARSLGALRDAMSEFRLRLSLYPADAYKPASRVVDGFLGWQAGLGERPFFALLNFNDAHGPYRSPPRIRARFQGSRPEIDAYDAAIAYIDEELDRLFGELSRRGALEHTLVIVTSDHGEQFGGHRLTGHANSLYLNLLSVPLVLRFPGRVPSGRRVTEPVTLRDVPATILDLVGSPAAGAVPGRSLARLWNGRPEDDPSPVVATLAKDRRLGPEFPNSRTEMESIVDRRLHYIRDGLGNELLYAYRNDPLEERDLARVSGWQDSVDHMRRALNRALSQAPPFATAGEPRRHAP
jgi:arylsulfatase A-like enzyme